MNKRNVYVMKDVYVHELAVVDEGATIGEGSKIWHFAHIRESATIGKNVIVGKSSYVDTEVIIGDNVKIQNLVSIYKGVEIEEEVFIGPHVAFTNDLYPRAKGEWELCKTLIKKGASLGANATIVCGNTVGSFAFIAAGSVVINDIPDQALFGGNPAKLLGWVCTCGRKIAGRDLKQGNHDIDCNHCGSANSILVPM